MQYFQNMLIENNPYYQTKFGFAYLGDSLQLMDKIYQLTPQQKYFLLAMIQSLTFIKKMTISPQNLLTFT